MCASFLTDRLERCILFISVALIVLCSPSICWSFEDGAVAKVVSLSGDVLVKSHGASVFKSSGEYWRSKPRFLFPGDSMVTADDGEARILFSQGRGGIILTRNSRLVIKSVKSSGSSILTSITQFTHLLYQLVLSGETASDEAGAYFLNYDPATDIEVETNAVIAAIRGTSVGITIEANRINTVDVIEGDVEVTLRESGQKRKLSTGDQLITDGRRDRTLTVASIDAVQWTLQLPPLLKDRLTLPSTLGRTMLMAYDHLQNGRPTEAHELLSDEIKRGDKDSVELYWLSALIELVLDRKGAALVSAEKAIALDPEDPTALLTFSYVQQSRAKLREATELAHRAAVNAQNNREIDLAVLAWVNLAQLQFGSDDLVAAQNSLAMAQSLSSQDPSVHNLHGFLQLARGLTAQARTSFLAAIDIDEDFAEPYLGLSLVEIRHGNELAALEAIATAALLEPRRSLYMSYWAKIQYERKQYGKALRLLDLAKRFDSNDPTPYFYEALILRDQNKPSDAIKALQGAIDRNDRRAVYRSRFLLDRDLAVKTADLSQIYSQLGFDAWAENTARASIKHNYSNYSGHTMLAGALAMQPDRAWGQESSDLLSRLLQPGSVNTFNSYNDYTTLVEKPINRGSFTIGSGNHSYHEISLIGFSAIPSSQTTLQIAAVGVSDDGWRGSNGEDRGSVAAILKWDIGLSDSLLTSVSRTRNKINDVFYPRYEYDFPAEPDNHTDISSNRLELGYHHRFGEWSNLLLYYSRIERGISSLDHWRRQFPTFEALRETIDDVTETTSYDQIQGQYSIGSDRYQILIGTLLYWFNDNHNSRRDQRIFQRGALVDAFDPLIMNQMLSRKLRTAYIQGHWHTTPNLTFEAGLYLDQFENGIVRQNKRWLQAEVNPRIGAIWTPTQRDTLRFSAFRYLLPPRSARLDPVDVAGIDIYRNGPEGALTDHVATAWEHSWERGLISVDTFFEERTFPKQLGRPYQHERLYGAQMNWNQLLPWQGTAIAADYKYLKLDNSGTFVDGFDWLSTDRDEHQLRFNLNVVNSNGLSLGFQQIYRHIDSKSNDILDSSQTQRPNEDIWVTNLKLNYEWPSKNQNIGLAIENLFDQRFNWVTDSFSLRSDNPIPQRRITAWFRMNF